MKGLRSACILVGLLSSAVGFAGSFNLDREHVANELIVKFKDPNSKSAVNFLSTLGATATYQFSSRGAQVLKFEGVKSNKDLLEKAERLSQRADVEYVEANTIIRVNAVPNDTNFSKQYGMHNTGATGGTADADIDAVEAWDISRGSKDVVVGVIDTGVDYTHPDIAPNYWNNPGETGTDASGKDKRTNGVDDDGNGYIDDFRGWDWVNNDNDPMDDHAHGTHCAGVIGARGNDGSGVAGVNWDVSIVGLKFLSGSGSGTLENAVKAIEYANKLGLRLTSNSWGGGGFSQTMFDAIKAANDKGILFIAAAGNDSRNNDASPSYPATYSVENIISVAASDSKDKIASFSNRGVRTVHVAAPGVDIFSTVPNNKFESMSGTSMATPHVAGVAALIMAAIPDATSSQVRARILNGVDRSPYWAGYVASGGRVNALNSIEVDNVPPANVSDLTIVESGSLSITAEWAPVGDDEDRGTASAYQIRQSATPIVTDQDWANARPLSVSTTLVNGKIQAVISFAEFNQSGYIAARAVDNVGNESRGVVSTAFATRQVSRFFNRNGQSLDGFTAQAPWGIETLADGTKVFSDSPQGQYAGGANVALTSNPIEIPSSDVTMVLDMKYDTESGYDFVNVEVSGDAGATWKSLARLTGSQPAFASKMYSLQSFGFAGNVQIRVRLESDSSVSKEGVHIRNISLVAPM